MADMKLEMADMKADMADMKKDIWQECWHYSKEFLVVFVPFRKLNNLKLCNEMTSIFKQLINLF